MNPAAAIRKLSVQTAILLLAGAALFLPSLPFERTPLDDELYIGQTHLLTCNAANLKTALTKPVLELHSPLTRLSFMADRLLWGEKALTAGCRLHNILLHLLASVLLLLLLRQLTAGDPRGDLASFWGALLFLLHPCRLESVIWIAERKDVQVAVAALAVLVLLVRERPSKWQQGTAALLYLLSFGAKPQLLPLPAIVILLETARSGNWKTAVKRSLPGWIIAGGYIVLNCVQLGRAVSRTVNPELALVNLGRYLWSCTVPLTVTVLPPLYTRSFSALLPTLLLAVTGISLLYALYRYRGKPETRAGLQRILLYLTAAAAAAAPTLGLFPIGNVDFACRYTYLPAIGVTAALTEAGLRYCHARPESRRLLTKLALICLAALAAASAIYLRDWRDARSLLERACAENNPHPQALIMLAAGEYRDGNYEEALALLRQTEAHPLGLAVQGTKLLIPALKSLIELRTTGNPAPLQTLDEIIFAPDAKQLFFFPANVRREVIGAAAAGHLAAGTPAETERAAAVFYGASEIEEDLDLVTALNYRSHAYRLRGNYAAAEAALTEALRLSPSDANLRANLESLLELRRRQGR